MAIKKYAENFLKHSYGLNLDIPIQINKRLRSTYGRLIIRNNKADKLEMAEFVMKYANIRALEDIIRHECIHYALFIKNMPYRDKDQVFKDELIKHQTSKTRTLKIGKYSQFVCTQCSGEILTSSKKLLKQPHRYVSRCCQAKIKFKSYKVFDGSEVQSNAAL